MKRLIPVTLGLVLLGVAAGPSLASPRGGDGAARARAHGHRGDRFERRQERMRHRRHHAMKLLKAMNLSDAQKADLKASREAAATVREDLRAKITAIIADARKGERTKENRKAAHEKIKAAVASAREAVAPSATRFVASLTPEQKKNLADRASKHGKTFDEAKLTKAIEGMLIAPDRGGRRGRHADRAK
jgi:hypothetical protein